MPPRRLAGPKTPGPRGQAIARPLPSCPVAPGGAGERGLGGRGRARSEAPPPSPGPARMGEGPAARSAPPPRARAAVTSRTRREGRRPARITSSAPPAGGRTDRRTEGLTVGGGRWTVDRRRVARAAGVRPRSSETPAPWPARPRPPPTSCPARPGASTPGRLGGPAGACGDVRGQEGRAGTRGWRREARNKGCGGGRATWRGRALPAGWRRWRRGGGGGAGVGVRPGWRVLGWGAPGVGEGMQRKGAPLVAVAGAGVGGARGGGGHAGIGG